MSRIVRSTKKNKYTKIENNRNKTEILYLQNIDYNYIKNRNIKLINFNYVLNHMFFGEKTSKEKINIESNIINIEKTKRSQIPLELESYKDTIKTYCKYAKLDIVSDDFKLELKKNHKLIVGLGHQSVKETSITIHKIYGVPYIPGQVLKGIFRNYIEKLCDKNKEDKKLLMKLLFREEEQRSAIHFFDSYPESQYTIDEDVINIHHQRYYSGKRKQNEEEKLMPIKFYVVKNTIFPILFALEEEHVNRVIQNDCDNKCKSFQEIKKDKYNEIRDLIYEAYTTLGIGAKTNVGYGFGEIKKGNEYK